jgi:hypothetical protein
VCSARGAGGAVGRSGVFHLSRWCASPKWRPDRSSGSVYIAEAHDGIAEAVRVHHETDRVALPDPVMCTAEVSGVHRQSKRGRRNTEWCASSKRTVYTIGLRVYVSSARACNRRVFRYLRCTPSRRVRRATAEGVS